MTDESGQIAVDFLLGISLVLITLSFTIQFIPGLFTSGSAGESSLDYTAYRTATILVEDTGWWENSTSNGTDWEYNLNGLKRIGLAADDDAGTKLTNTPNIISKDKIEQFMLLNENTLTELLGLYTNVEDSHFTYGYNISLIQDKAPFIQNNTAVSRGEKTPDDREISKITRIALVAKGTAAILSGNGLTGISSSKVTINVTGDYEENITIGITDINVSGIDPLFLNASLNGVKLNQPSDLTIYKMEGWEHSALNGSFNSTDLICFNIDSSLLNSSIEHDLLLEFNNVTFEVAGPPFVNYNSMSIVHYEPVYLTVEVWQ